MDPDHGEASCFHRCYNCVGCRAPNCGACKGCRGQNGPEMICVRRPCHLHPNQPMPKCEAETQMIPRQCFATGCHKTAQKKSKYCSVQCKIDYLKSTIKYKKRDEELLCSENTAIASKWEKLRKQLMNRETVEIGGVTIHKIKSDKKANSGAKEIAVSKNDADDVIIDLDDSDDVIIDLDDSDDVIIDLDDSE